MRTFLLINLLTLIFYSSCTPKTQLESQTTSIKNKTMDSTTQNNTVIISAPVVEKNFIKKNGQETGYGELYLQRSVDDYFIKFCESKITRKELEEYLNRLGGPIKTVKVEAEFKQGLFDQCPGDEYEVQSRFGEYVIIYRIIE